MHQALPPAQREKRVSSRQDAGRNRFSERTASAPMVIHNANQ
jgi:hypothetical protein